ncbi:alpha/beta fold hydrolase [Microlunatus phosphovorus]|uniref:alpha/beta fold hydrolase n=1 Tax=Microlunatus phosphovorus TaxID=29405 RepID=UPI00155ABC7A|nr:alpha/beta hydrolase [Microlunatus phosphovorus]
MTAERAPMVRELGRGRPILVVHGGMGNEVPWLRVAKAMSTRYRVVLIRRRLYRLEIPVRLEQAIADQVAEVLDVARGFDEPCVIVGHSSGALIALEALAADSGPFAGGIIYEPPTPLPELPFGEPGLGPRARAALDAGHVGRALQIYLREGFRAPNWWSAVAPALALLPVVRQFVPRQIDDYESMVRLGVRLDAYATIDCPLWVLAGEKSPAHFRQRSARLAATHPRADLVMLPGAGHNANQSQPRRLGDLICDFAKPLIGDSAGRA